MYLSYDEYVEIMKNPSVGQDSFDNYLVYAEAVVDAFTFSVIGKKNLMTVPYYKDMIKKATAFQIEYMAKADSIDSYMDESGKKVASRSVTIGGTSESVTYANNDAEAMTSGGMKVAPVAAFALAPVKALGRMVC